MEKHSSIFEEWRWGEGEREGISWLWNTMRDPNGERNVLCLVCINQYPDCDIILPVVLQDVSTGETWVKDTQDFSVLFLRNACKLQLSAN